MGDTSVDRFDDYCRECERTPEASLRELAGRLGISVKSVERYRTRYNDIMKERDFPGLDDISGRAARFLIWMARHTGPVSSERARRYFQTELELNEKTIERCMKFLRDRGLIQAVPGGYVPGDAILPKLNLLPDELDYIAGYLEEFGRQSPLGPRLQSVLLKIRLGADTLNAGRLLDRAHKRQRRFMIKGPRTGENSRHLPLVDELLDAAEAGFLLSLEYVSPRTCETMRPVVQPRGVVYNWLTDAWYLVAINQDAKKTEYYRLDRLNSHQRVGEGVAADSEAFPEHLSLAWGMENGPLYEVVVRFRPDFNVQEKVRHDLMSRSSACLTAEPDGSLIMMDTICGLGEFSRWLRQFGASAAVEKPGELRSVLLEGVRRKLARYGLSTSGEAGPDE